MKILISGASGWLGRSAINVVSSQFKNNIQITTVSTTKKIIRISNESYFETKTYEELIQSDEKFDGFIHLASLTRDKARALPFNDYVANYLNISSKATQLLNHVTSWFIFVSSGAVWKVLESEFEDSLSDNPYGFLKRLEEVLFSEICRKSNLAFVCGRLWGAGGYDMRNYKNYALGSFILDGISDNKNAIEILSSKPVFRRYVDSRSFMKLCIKLAINRETLTFNSGGTLIEIGELAQIVSRYFNNIPITRPTLINGSPDLYYPNTSLYESLCSSYQIENPSIEELVKSTIDGARIYLQK